MIIRDGTAISRITVRSISFMIFIFIFSVIWIKAFPSGQIGYGDRIQVDGKHITLLGYAVLLKWSGLLGLLVFGSAVLTSLFVRKKNDDFI